MPPVARVMGGPNPGKGEAWNMCGPGPGEEVSGRAARRGGSRGREFTRHPLARGTKQTRETEVNYIQIGYIGLSERSHHCYWKAWKGTNALSHRYSQ